MLLQRKPAAILIMLMLLLTGILVSGCLALGAPPAFNGERAYSILEKQCSFGPRPPGTEAHKKTRDYLISELKQYSNAVEAQAFTHASAKKTYDMWNIIARFGDTAKPGILLAAHWDTRPMADQEVDPARRKLPITGANDGASGVAVLLELARIFHESPPPVPVTIVLFDGEDFGYTSDQMYLGSRYFAARLKDFGSCKFGILLDMVGDKDLNINREGYSNQFAKSVVDRIWAAAKARGFGEYFPDEVKYAVMDDHLPLIQAGLPCADVIDFDYAYWHTLSDTPDKCSAKSLKIVGDVISYVVYSPAP
ncbi:MAG: M28 family peptidase [Armatimonadota bacterium]